MNYKSKIYLSIGIFIVIIFVMFFFSIYPLYSSIRQDSESLLNNKKELASIEYLTKSFEDFERNFLLYEEGLKEMEGLLNKESLIDPEIPIEFINFFKEKSQELDLNLRITALSTDDVEDNHWNTLKFRVTGVGRVDHVRNFIEKLENSKWLLSVVEFTASSHQLDGEDVSRNYISINMIIEIYAQD